MQKTLDSVVLSNIDNIDKMVDPILNIQEHALQFAFMLAKELGVKDIRNFLKTRLNERSLVGIKKYGVMLSEADLPRETLIAHALEECLDLANYMQAIFQLDK